MGNITGRVPDAIAKAINNENISDAELVEALGVMETFIAFNRFLDSLDVEIDF